MKGSYEFISADSWIHMQECVDPDCEWCEWLVENGFTTSCEFCGHVGDNESDGWDSIIDENGGVTVLCEWCKEKILSDIP